jgi:hypothetical protein
MYRPGAVATPALRPLAIGEVLDVAIKITFRHARTLALVVLIVVAPAQILSAAVSVSQPETFLDVEGSSVPSDQDVATTIGAFAAIIVLALLSSTLATGACFKAIVDAYLGSTPSWRSSLAFAARRLHSLIWLSILAYVLGAFALLGLIVLGVWLFVSWTVAVPAMLTEDVRGLKALRRSFRLVRGMWWRTFAIFLLGFILAGVLSSIIQGIVASLSFAADSTAAEFVLTSIGGILGALISTPFSAAFITVLYVDLRVRKEGFDLQLLAERLGGGQPVGPGEFLPPPPPVAPGPGEDQPPFWPPPPGWKPRSETTEP